MTVQSATGAEALAALLRAARSAVALTGAGISVPSGIPDFRSPGTGLWENVDPMAVAHIDVFRSEPERFWHFYGDRFASLEDKEPNGAHRALVSLERRGLLDAVITQNVDRLHAKAGTRNLIELHGSIARSACMLGHPAYDLGEVRARQAHDARGVPRCDCGEPLKPGVVLFGEYLPRAALAAAETLAQRADVVLCVGSSLEVYPVAQLPSLTLAGGGQVAILTRGPTPLDEAAAVRLDGDVEDELSALLAAL